MEKYLVLVGIDVSKNYLDSYVIAAGKERHEKFENTKSGIRSLINHAASSLQSSDTSKILFCLEHTGVYAMPLCSCLSEQKLDYALVPAIEIKRSLGLQRGKNDKADAKAIARYALLYQHEIKLFRLPEKDLVKLKLMLGHRDRLMESRKVFMVAAAETKSFLDKDICREVINDSNRMVLYINKRIEKAEKLIMEIVNSNQELKKIYDLITSVPGIGMQIAVSLIVTTRCFSCFQQSRQLACYAGVAPFEYRSGSSVRGRTKVSHMANKKIKSLLHMGAIVAIRHDKQLKEYYYRKLQEGKNAMCVINAIRNKLIARIFAVVNRGTPFVHLHQHVA
ncbi:MAG TPA: IS110 family transposase [Puia sp.]|nr:IS110 family transposase [Puia sp.]